MGETGQFEADRLATRYQAGVPCRKPLYLLSEANISCDVANDVLLVRRPGTAVQRFPLARITRIVTGNKVAWSGRALTACLENGVTMTWVDGRGHPLGNTQPRCVKPESLTTLIETYLEMPDWTSRFDNWRARRRLETLVTSTKRHAEAGQLVSASRFAERKRAYVQHGQFSEVFEHIGESFCHAFAIDRLHKIGLQARYFGYDGTVLELGPELASLLWAEFNFDAGSLFDTAEMSELVVRVFESWSHLREGRLLEHVGDLRRHLSREIDSWC